MIKFTRHKPEMRKRKLAFPFLEGIQTKDRQKHFFKNFGRDFSSDGDNFSRLVHLKFLIIFITVVLFIRLFQLTIIEGKKYRELAEGNRIRYLEIEAPRGKILARGGEILADWRVAIFLESQDGRFELSEQQAADLEAEGVAGEFFLGQLGRVIRRTWRVYPQGSVFAHVLGYISPVAQEDLQKDKNLSNAESVGRLGVEDVYDQVLRGDSGAKIVEVDAAGRVISILGQKEPVSGSDIRLTLDAALQRAVFESLSLGLEKANSSVGAAIVSDAASGEILAMVSLPSFDPDDVARAVVDQEKPLFNRAVSGNYPPGSVFKPVSAIAGLESGKIDRDTEIEDVGEFSIGEFKFGNWYFLNYGGRDGLLKIDRAIARSNDIYFYRLGEAVGLKKLREVAIKLGFGKKSGIDLPNEAFGLVPDEVWKQSSVGENWFLGDTLHMAIGQGFILATPLQVNNMTNVIANGGKLVKPHLVWEVKDTSGEIKISNRHAETVVDGSVLSVVREGMRMACEKGGTAWPFFDAPYKVGCKTGTAEKLQGNPHAWFTAFAPYDAGKIAITVIIEDGGEGSSVAAPVAREVLDWWFANR